MGDTTHYLTSAAFRVHDKDDVINEVSLNDSIPYKTIIKKLCSCGSQIEFEKNQKLWYCSTSGTDLEILPFNHDPLLTQAEIGDKLGFEVPELRQPKRDAVVTLDETGGLHVLLKVEAKDQWMITDPVPIRDLVTVRPFETHLLMHWLLIVGDSFTGELDFTVACNPVDAVHERILKRLVSTAAIICYFLDANSLSVIAAKPINLALGTSNHVAKALALYASLPEDHCKRQEALSGIALGQEASKLSVADKMGMCPEMTRFLISPLSSMDVYEMSEHIKACPLCQNRQA
jgi:hypothetical protein